MIEANIIPSQIRKKCSIYTQVASRCYVQRDDLSSLARQRFVDIVALH